MLSVAHLKKNKIVTHSHTITHTHTHASPQPNHFTNSWLSINFHRAGETALASTTTTIRTCSKLAQSAVHRDITYLYMHHYIDGGPRMLSQCCWCFDVGGFGIHIRLANLQNANLMELCKINTAFGSRYWRTAHATQSRTDCDLMCSIVNSRICPKNL